MRSSEKDKRYTKLSYSATSELKLSARIYRKKGCSKRNKKR